MTKGGTISLGCRGLTKDPGPLDEEAKLGCSHAQHLPLDRARASTQGTPVSPDLRANSKINAVTTLLLGKRVLTRLMAPDGCWCRPRAHGNGSVSKGRHRADLQNNDPEGAGWPEELQVRAHPADTRVEVLTAEHADGAPRPAGGGCQPGASPGSP